MNYLIFTLAGFLAVADSQDGDPLAGLRSSIPGEPGVDYPILSSVQETSFSCSGLVFGGYYADQEQGCQAYHVCLRGPRDLFPVSFLCPNGTLFNQRLFVCDWWFNVECGESADLYAAVEGAFGEESESVEECPATPVKTEEECEGSVSSCWSPGQRDTDCPNSGLCCYDGCANTCLDDTKYSPRLEQQKLQPSSTQQPSIKTVTTEQVTVTNTDLLSTTYSRSVVTPTTYSTSPSIVFTTSDTTYTTPPTPGYSYSTPPPQLQLLFDKPSTPPPGLPVLYGPPPQ